MAEYKLVIGFTDEWDDEGFRQPNFQGSEGNKHYNLYKQNPSLEKQNVTWRFLSERPGVQKLLKHWEMLIRIPHLKMIDIKRGPHPLNPEFNSYDLSIQFFDLIPIDKDHLVFDEEDYGFLQQEPKFGDFYWNYNQLLPEHMEYTESLDWAHGQDNMENLMMPDSLRLGSFLGNLSMNHNNIIGNLYGVDSECKLWMEKNKEELEKRGYKLDDPRTTVGSYVIAEIVDTKPYELYKIISETPYVCRISIIEE